jgi:quercetin dioxygenase-like cupin family protein
MGQRAWRSLPAVGVALAIVALLAACGGSAGGSATTAAPSAPTASGNPVTVRTVLAGGNPSQAPGYQMQLTRYTIPPHTKLAAHHHPGMQLAYIESGTLTYTVIAGTVTVNAVDGSTRTIGPGQTGTISTGEWLTETADIVHFGENATDQPVSILASSLFVIGDPPAILVTPAPSPTT